MRQDTEGGTGGRKQRTAGTFMQDEWRPGLFYHVIGKAVEGETLFRDEDDMRWFIKNTLRFKLYHYFEILVYCLCGNHFHLVVRTRSVEDIRASLATKPRKSRSPTDEMMLVGDIGYLPFVFRSMKGATAGYARHYGHKYGRSGKLFLTPVLHGLTDKGAPGELFSRRLGCYVGLNFVKHNMGAPGDKYFGSSLTNPLYRIVNRPLLLELFGGEDAYVHFHNAYLRRHGHDFWDTDEEDFYAVLRPRYFDKTTSSWREGDWTQDLG